MRGNKGHVLLQYMSYQTCFYVNCTLSWKYIIWGLLRQRNLLMCEGLVFGKISFRNSCIELALLSFIMTLLVTGYCTRSAIRPFLSEMTKWAWGWWCAWPVVLYCHVWCKVIYMVSGVQKDTPRIQMYMSGVNAHQQLCALLYCTDCWYVLLRMYK